MFIITACGNVDTALQTDRITEAASPAVSPTPEPTVSSDTDASPTPAPTISSDTDASPTPEPTLPFSAIAVEVVYEPVELTDETFVYQYDEACKDKGLLFDIDGDNNPDKLYIQYSDYQYHLWINEEHQLNTSMIILSDIDRTDAYVELMLVGKFELNVFHYVNHELTVIGDLFSNGYEPYYEQFSRIDDTTIRCEEDLFLIDSHIHLLGEFQVTEKELLLRKGNYEILGNRKLTLLRPLNLYQDKDTTTAYQTAAENQEIFFRLTDGYNWVYFQAEDGTEGWVYWDAAALTVNNVLANEVFTDFNTAQ